MMTPVRDDARRLILAADHRARGVTTVERWHDLLAALRAALPHCDGLMATTRPLVELNDDLEPIQTAWLSLNRTGLAGTPFELDDRLIATCARAADLGCEGVKHMVRIDRHDPITARALELLGEVLEAARVHGLRTMIESLSWSDGAIDRSIDGVIGAAVIANDMGADILKLPVPDGERGRARIDAVRRVVDSVGVPVLFLGGPRRDDRDALLVEIRDAMAGGAAGVAIGRAVYQDPDPAGMAKAVAAIVHD